MVDSLVSRLGSAQSPQARRAPVERTFSLYLGLFGRTDRVVSAVDSLAFILEKRYHLAVGKVEDTFFVEGEMLSGLGIRLGERDFSRLYSQPQLVDTVYLVAAKGVYVPYKGAGRDVRLRIDESREDSVTTTYFYATIRGIRPLTREQMVRIHGLAGAK